MENKRLSAHSSLISRRGILAGMAGVAGGVLMPRTVFSQGEVLRWGSSSLGSTGYVIIEGLTQVANRHSQFQHASVGTAGGAENMALLGTGELTFGNTSSSDWLPALNGLSPYPGPIEVHQMFSYAVWEMPLLVRADSDINSYADLAGKKIMPSHAGSSAAILFHTILEGAGVVDDVEFTHGSWVEAYDALKIGAVDAVPAILVNGRVSPITTEVATAVELRAVPSTQEELNAAAGINPGVLGSTVTPEQWGLLGEPMLMPSVSGVLASHPSVTPEMAYDVTKAVLDNAEEVRAVGSQLQDVSIEMAVRFLIPQYKVNPGAAQYLKEQGVWRDELQIADI